MLTPYRGFSLLETAIALLIASTIMLSAARLLPPLQSATLAQSRLASLRATSWQLAFTIGQHLQRAGYCKGECGTNGLTLSADGQCLIVQWDANHNGRWDTTPARQSEQTGFRLRGASLETQRGVQHCQGGGWQSMTDPRQIRITAFNITRQPRHGLPPLFHITLNAQTPKGDQQLRLHHSVVGYNL